jgi:hypothetical protein
MRHGANTDSTHGYHLWEFDTHRRCTHGQIGGAGPSREGQATSWERTFFAHSLNTQFPWRPSSARPTRTAHGIHEQQTPDTDRSQTYERGTETNIDTHTQTTDASETTILIARRPMARTLPLSPVKSQHEPYHPDPHYTVGYTGHCPNAKACRFLFRSSLLTPLQFQMAETYATTTYRILTSDDPRVTGTKSRLTGAFASDIRPISSSAELKLDPPTTRKAAVMEDRAARDPTAKYTPVRVPGYTGYIPRARNHEIASTYGKTVEQAVAVFTEQVCRVGVCTTTKERRSYLYSVQCDHVFRVITPVPTAPPARTQHAS